MEINYSELKQKDVININDGSHLGKVCDLSFTFPEGNVIGFTVTGGKGFKFTRQEIFLPFKSVVKIGEDAVLVRHGKKDCPPEPPQNDCPPRRPPKCPPKCPPQNDCPPNGFNPNDRRSFDEYE